MLSQSPTPAEKRPPRSWSLLAAGGLLGLSVVVAGVSLKAVAAPPAPETKKEEPKKDEPKKDEPKKEEPKKGEPKKSEPGKNPQLVDPFDVMPDFDKLFENLPGVNQEQLKQMREEMKRAREQMRKALEQGRFERAGALPVFPGILPDAGKGPEEMQKALERLRQAQLGRLGRGEQPREGRLGVRVETPSDVLVDQLDLPQNQGLVVDEIKADSPASKVGLKDHDILLEVNGKAVPSNAGEFAKQVGDIKANTPVDVVVLRKGKKETLKGLSLPEVKVEKPVERPRLNFQFPNVFPGGKQVETQVTRNGDEFTIQRKEGDHSITISGKVEDGKPVPASIEIGAGKETKKYDSLEKVPEEHRGKVKTMLQSVTGKAAGRNVQEF